jgi:hypothetical protein
MLQIGSAVIMLIFGLVALRSGKLKVIGNRAIYGRTARIIGWLCLCPLFALIALWVLIQLRMVGSVRTYEALAGSICWFQIAIFVAAAIAVARTGGEPRDT